MSTLEVPASVPDLSQWRATIDDGAILGLWKLGHDTYDIAKKVRRSQGQVANRLAWLRDRGAK